MEKKELTYEQAVGFLEVVIALNYNPGAMPFENTTVPLWVIIVDLIGVRPTIADETIVELARTTPYSGADIKKAFGIA